MSDNSSPNPYVQLMAQLMQDEFARWAFNEQLAPTNRGRWRELIFKSDQATPLDLEIGTGNGFHFAHRAASYPNRQLIGIELKYKPLVQSIRRALRAGCVNARIIRYNADNLRELFSAQELDDIFIHFPDPWPKKRHWKHRLITPQFLDDVYDLQRLSGKIEIKTDNRDYFDWCVERVSRSRYHVDFVTYDLQNSELAKQNYITHFERLFMRQGLPIHQITLSK